MSLFELFIRRPVLATVLSILVTLLGAVSYTRLVVREYPNIDEPIVTVRTTYPGASPEIMESQITQILENSITGSSISVGRRPRTRPTRSRTSEAATSGSMFGRKRTVIWLVSWRLRDVRISMPSTPAIEFSRICVICDSMISGLAPG